MEPDQKTLDLRWMRVLAWLVSILLAVLLGIVGWVVWVSVTGTGASNVEILRVVEDTNRQARLANCILLVRPDERTSQEIANCVAQLGRP